MADQADSPGITEDQGASPAQRDRLFVQVYDELRGLARRMLSSDRASRHVSATELVHGAAIKIIGQREISAKERTHFFAYSAHIMRQVLIDEVRRERAGKRDAPQITLITQVAESVSPDEPVADVEAIHEALQKLTAASPDLGRLVELRYFSGLTLEEIADMDGVSHSTVKRNWRVARAWLYDALKSA